MYVGGFDAEGMPLLTMDRGEAQVYGSEPLAEEMAAILRAVSGVRGTLHTGFRHVRVIVIPAHCAMGGTLHPSFIRQSSSWHGF